MIILYAIMHKPTGHYLPELSRKTCGGYTHTEPCVNLPPRLFTTERGAKNALTWWLKGVTVQSYSTSYEGEVDETQETYSLDELFKMAPDVKVRLNAAHVSDRKAEEMAVVPVGLSCLVEFRQ